MTRSPLSIRNLKGMFPPILSHLTSFSLPGLLTPQTSLASCPTVLIRGTRRACSTKASFSTGHRVTGLVGRGGVTFIASSEVSGVVSADADDGASETSSVGYESYLGVGEIICFMGSWPGASSDETDGKGGSTGAPKIPTK